ncbi:winged helix-turn-helix domain-containing protein [Providencia vermicola]|uniref:winged helix-turn-helix domain-containing protein n=1 Tax=Providencia vermicola TaxID=333965 RepID=UPI001CED8575|nr:LysR family transcriptional regulator [Providencia vermicola]
MVKTKKANSLLVRPRIYVNDNISIGPGKIDLLRAIDGFHSLSAAARDINIPYKKAWLLIDSLNKGIGKPVVIASSGGTKGGGSVLTPLGRGLLNYYDQLEAHLNEQSQNGLKDLEQLLFDT